MSIDIHTSQLPPKHRSFSALMRVIAFVLCFLLFFEQSGFAQVAGQLDISGSIAKAAHLFSPGFIRQPHLRYISYDKLNQSFKIILNKGDAGRDQVVAPSDALRQPLNFFYIGLAIPNESFWVNLRPDSPAEVIDDSLASTDLGKILLEADLELKKDLARATFPASASGKEYWEKIYNKIEEVYGYGFENNPVAINTRIWITPGEVIICQDQNSAYVYKAGLKVSTETAYFGNQNTQSKDERLKVINQYSSQLMQELILPQISKEVNTGKKYAALRQVYYSLILAQWFKNKFYGAGGLYPYLIDRNNLTGLTSRIPWSKDTYFKAYQKSLKDKEYDLQVQVFNIFGRSIRTYSTGGVDFTGILIGASHAQVKVISSSTFEPPLIEQDKLLEVSSQSCTLQEPYLGQVHPGSALPQEAPLPILEPANRETGAIDPAPAVSAQDDLPVNFFRKLGLWFNGLSLRVLFSPVIRKPLNQIANVLFSLPKPLLKLMCVLPITSFLLFTFHGTASAFSITADVANGGLQDLTFTFQPWQDSPDPGNETLSGIGQIIGAARGLEGDALTDFIYNQFIPEMRPVLASQGIADINVIRVGEQIKIPARFLEGLSVENVEGVVNSLQQYGWNPLDFNVNIIDPNPFVTSVDPTGIPPNSTVFNTPYPAAASTPDPLGTAGNPFVTPVDPAGIPPNSTVFNTPYPTAVSTPVVTSTQNSSDFLTQVLDWVTQNDLAAALIITGTVLAFFIARGVYVKNRAAQAARRQKEAAEIADGSLAQGIIGRTNAMLQQAGAANHPPADNGAVSNSPVSPVGLDRQGDRVQAEEAAALAKLQALAATQLAQAPPEPSVVVIPQLDSSDTRQHRKISADEIDQIIERLKASPRQYLQRLLRSQRINLRERIRFIADELGFDILNGHGVSLLVRNPETLRRNREFLESLALPATITNLQSSRRSFVDRELRQIVKYAQWQQMTDQERLAVVSYLFDVYGLRSSWITRDQEWARVLERFNLDNTPIDYSSRAIDFIQQYELARFIRFGQPRRTEIRLSKIQEIVEIMGLKVAQSLEQVKTPEGFQLYAAKANQGSEAIDKLPTVEAAPQSYTEPKEPEFQDGVVLTDELLDQPAESSAAVVITPEAKASLKQFEAIFNTKITDLQIRTVLNFLLNSSPGEEDYENARALIRHIHPGDFLRIKKAAQTIEPFASSQLLQERFDLIVIERPSELNVGLVRSISKIHDWEELLKHPVLSMDDLARIIACCERIIEVLPLRLTQETNDQIGSINKVIKQSYNLVLKTVNKLLKQPGLDKDLYGERISVLLDFGDYFADYQSALGYLQDLDTAKKYQYDGQEINGNGNGNGNVNGNGNGQAHRHKEVRYNWWHKITAVPAIEVNARNKLGRLLPLLNTEGNVLTMQEYFAKLKPTRIGSSQSWWVRKRVSVGISLFLSSISLMLFIFGAPIDPTSPLFILKGALIIIGFASTPLIHFIFAKIGAMSAARFSKKAHAKIIDLEVRWNSNRPFPKTRIKFRPREEVLKISVAALKNQTENKPAVDKPGTSPLPEEDHAAQGAMVSRQDVEAIAELAGLLEIPPTELPEINVELEKLFGPGRVISPVFRIMPQAQMLTRDGSQITRPVRLGNQIFMGDEYFAARRNDFQGLLADLAHEQMAQWVAVHHPEQNAQAHHLAQEMEKIIEVTPRDSSVDVETAPEPETPVALASAPGGIDLRSIAYKVEEISALKDDSGGSPAAASDSGGNPEQDLVQINRLIEARIIPSGERLAECLSKIPAQDQERYVRQINNCLAKIFMLEEEYSTPSQASLVKLLEKVILN